MTANRFRLFSMILTVVLFLSACGGNIALPTPTPAPTQTAVPPTSTFTPAPTATITPTATPDLLPQCKLPLYPNYDRPRFGFPKPSYIVPSVGNVKTVILFADFSDVPASKTTEETFSLLSPATEKLFTDISYGKLSLNLEPHLVWLRLSRPSSFYGSAIRTLEGHRAFIQEAITLADPEVDFSTADSVTVIVPTEATKIPYGPAFTITEGNGYEADGKNFANGITSGADLEQRGSSLWLAPVTLFTMGLPYLWGTTQTIPGLYGYTEFTGGFGLMSNAFGWGMEPFAFERWQLGWLDDSQIFCQPAGEQTLTLTAIELTGGTKAVVVPLKPTNPNSTPGVPSYVTQFEPTTTPGVNPSFQLVLDPGSSKLLVIESRRAIGYDSKLPKSGVLVYLVDNYLETGSGPLVIYPDLQGDPNRYDTPLAVGESVTVEGVTVTVLASTEQGDTVKVTVGQ